MAGEAHLVVGGAVPRRITKLDAGSAAPDGDDRPAEPGVAGETPPQPRDISPAHAPDRPPKRAVGERRGGRAVAGEARRQALDIGAAAALDGPPERAAGEAQQPMIGEELRQ